MLLRQCNRLHLHQLQRRNYEEAMLANYQALNEETVSLPLSNDNVQESF